MAEGGIAVASSVGVTGWIVSVLLGWIVWARAWGEGGLLGHVGWMEGGVVLVGRLLPVEEIALEDHGGT